MTQYAVLILGFAGAIIAFFYKKGGEKEAIGPVGYVILILLASVFAINLYVTYDKQMDETAARAALAESIADEKQAQSALMMQYIELDRPFDFANFNLLTNYQIDDETGDVHHPLQREMMGILPFPPAGSEDTAVAYFSLDPYELPTHEYGFIVQPDGMMRVDLLNVQTGKEPFALYSQGGSCKFSTGDCPDYNGKNLGKFRWFEELLNSTYGQGVLLETDQLAAEYVSKLLQQDKIGLFSVRNIYADSSYVSFITEEVQASFRFIQNYKGRLAGKCYRSIYIKVLIRPMERKGEDAADCREGFTCFTLAIEPPIKVIPCELSLV